MDCMRHRRCIDQICIELEGFLLLGFLVCKERSRVRHGYCKKFALRNVVSTAVVGPCHSRPHNLFTDFDRGEVLFALD
jgi:hypothetical protein